MHYTPIRAARTLVSLCLLLGLAAGPAAADWLRTRDGARLETRGPWRVKGESVVFIAPQGALRSIRLSEIDLEASERLTAGAARGPAPPVEVATVREPVLVLTDKDVPRAAEVTGTPDAAVGPGKDTWEFDSIRMVAPRETVLDVISWRTVENPAIDGIEIVGTILNPGGRIVTGVSVVTRLFDGRAELLGTANAFLETDSLAPRTSTTFRALFPGVFFQGGEPKFEIHSTTLEIKGAAKDGNKG